MFTSGGNEIKVLREREKARKLVRHVKYDSEKGAKDPAACEFSQRNYRRSLTLLSRLLTLLIASRNRALDSFTLLATSFARDRRRACGRESSAKLLLQRRVVPTVCVCTPTVLFVPSFLCMFITARAIKLNTHQPAPVICEPHFPPDLISN